MKGTKQFAVSSLIIAFLFAFTSRVVASEPLSQQGNNTANIKTHSCEALVAFKMRLHDAIRSALKYPTSVLYHGAYGITTLRYDFLNGQATNIQITNSSGDGALDRAAIAAVKNAKYAEIHPAIDNMLIHDLVFIVFDNTGVLSRNTPNPGGKNAKKHTETDCVAG